MGVVRSSETLIHKQTTRRYMPEDGDFQDAYCLKEKVACKLLLITVKSSRPSNGPN